MLTDDFSVALLRHIAQTPDASQRELARRFGVSVGKIHFAVHALIDKGWVKAGNFHRSANKLGYVYLLTPSGIDAKARLTRQFLARKMREYEHLREEIGRLQREVADTQPAGEAPATGDGRGLA